MLWWVILVSLSLCAAAPITNEEKETAMNYFKQYGYLPENYEELKNKEILLKRAIKKFIKFSGIKNTDEMNNEIMEMMKQPRCGMKDVSSRTSRLANFVTTGRRWSTRNLSYRINSYSEKLNRNDLENSIRNGFNIWTRYTNLNFVRTNGPRSHFRVGFYRRRHGDNDAFDGPGNVLAHAFFPTNGNIHFDEDEGWDPNFNFRTTHMFQVAAHEIGHALGLDHSRTRGSLMQPFYNRYVNYLNGLSRDDIYGIRYLYGGKSARSTDSCTRKITSAAFDEDDVLYVFKDGKYTTDESSGDIKNVTDVWQGVDPQSKILITHSKTYFFNGDKFWRFTGTTLDEDYPQKISERFPSIPDNIDAAVFINKQIYFFKGENFWIFDPTKNPRVSPEYPKLISMEFKGLPNDLEAVLSNSENDELFAIKDGEVYFYDFATKNVTKETLSDYFMCLM